ncbi:MAG TPA: sigma-70 family RNA polymerase sigma factor [Candidatus Limnocylindrales bacterium]|nr:sigma-70 family RNA polymerase sigma factor [Candidatus Limnocylindrales bacterium]
MIDPSDALADVPDHVLVGRIAMGDEVAFGAAYDRHAGLVYGSVVRFLGDRESAAEIVQDAFLSLWRRADQFDPHAGSLSAWLLGIARHRAIDRFRAEARRAASRSIPLSALLPDDGGPGSSADVPPGVSSLAGDDGPAVRDPAALADRRWVQSVVRNVVAGLPAPEREVVLLAYAGGLSQSEIASHLDAPIGTVKSRTRRALARLRALLGEVPDVLDDLAASDAGERTIASPR